jgi:hypothetical protein
MGLRVLLLALGLGLGGAPASALERGESCVLQAPLPMVVTQRSGTIELTIDKGVEVTVVASGDEGRTGISTGDAAGTVATRDLEAACAGTLQSCRLTAPVTMFEQTRSDSKAWRLKPGAVVSVLRTGKVWTHLRLADLEGFARQEELTPVCQVVTPEASETEVTVEVERGDGPGLLFQPFLLEKNAPAGEADAVADLFFERLAIYRPDVARLPLSTTTTREAVKWKAHAGAAAAAARSAGLSYAVIGQVSVEAGDGKTALVLNLAVVDARAEKVLKGIKVRPTLKPEDLWIENALATLLPYVSAAPGAKPPPTVKGQSTSTPTPPLR